MTVRRFSISFEEELAAAVSASAENANEALSSWLAEAARRRVKQEALARAVEDYEREFGTISEDDVALAMQQLDAKAAPIRTQPKRRAA
jgi:NACalpha-BTF3-like transcription factor